jgi:hypothetical protein
MAEGNPAFGEIVGGHFHHDLVAGQDADEVQPHFSGNVRQNAMPVSQFHPEPDDREKCGALPTDQEAHTSQIPKDQPN